MTVTIKSDDVALVCWILVALVAGPIGIRDGWAEIKGSRPKIDSFGYRRALTLVNLCNELGGAPQQPVVYEKQWQVLAYWLLGSGVLFLLSIPFAILALMGWWR